MEWMRNIIMQQSGWIMGLEGHLFSCDDDSESWGSVLMAVLVLYHFDQLFGHRSQQHSKRRLGQFVTSHNGNLRDEQKFLAPAAHGSPKICWRNVQDVTPHLRHWRDAHLFMAVTGHRSQGAKSTVQEALQLHLFSHFLRLLAAFSWPVHYSKHKNKLF
jgi:hypothetical protein